MTHSLSAQASVQDVFGVQAPVFKGSFDQTGDHDKQQHQHVDTCEHFIHHSRLFYSKRQQPWKQHNTYFLNLLQGKR